MTCHREIDDRGLRLAQVIAQKIDANGSLLEQVKRWASLQQAPAYREWQAILQKPWQEIRRTLLDPGEEGKRLRQSSPFVGILTPQERWTFFRPTTR